MLFALLLLASVPPIEVSVSPDGIRLGEQIILKADAMRNEAYLNVPVLEEKLRDVKKRDGGAVHGAALVVDPTVPFWWLKRVLFSVTSAGVRPITLRVGNATEPLSLDEGAIDAGARVLPLVIELKPGVWRAQLGATRYAIVSSGEQLAKQLAEMKKNLPDQRQATLAASDPVTAKEIADAWAPCRAAGLDRLRLVPISELTDGAATTGQAGTIEKESVARVIRASLQKISACYETALARAPELSGKIVARIVIATSGKVTKAEAQEDTLNDAPLQGCVLTVVRALKFDPPPIGGPVTISYPFILSLKAN